MRTHAKNPRQLVTSGGGAGGKVGGGGARQTPPSRRGAVMEYKHNCYCYNGQRIMRKLAGLLYPMVVSGSPRRWLKFRRRECQAYDAPLPARHRRDEAAHTRLSVRKYIVTRR